MRLLGKRKRRKLGYRQVPYAKLLFIGRNRFGSIFRTGQRRGLFGRNLVKTRNREKATGIVQPTTENGMRSPDVQLVVAVFQTHLPGRLRYKIRLGARHIKRHSLHEKQRRQNDHIRIRPL